MNYINQTNIFFRLAGSAELSSSARILYLALLHKNNSLAWIPSFTCTAIELEGLSGLGKSSLMRSRQQLADKGLIEYKKRGNKAPRYSIIELNDEVMKAILDNHTSDLVPQAVPQPVPQTTPQVVPQAVPQPVPLNKPNQTKQNNYIDNAREEFTLEIWPKFPKKQNFEPAFDAYLNALKSGATKDLIITKLGEYKNYLRVKHKGDGFTANPDTWLENKRWMDEYDMTPEQRGPKGQRVNHKETLPDWANDDQPKSTRQQGLTPEQQAQLDKQLEALKHTEEASS